MRIVGYDVFIKLLKSAYVLRMIGAPAHVLVVSPPGTAKTTTAKLFAKAIGATFVRTTGRYDMLPEDFVAEKEIEYVNGNPTIVWRLRAVGRLLEKDNPKPAVWFFDEFDKMNRKSMFALLELMEEQQVTLPTGETYKLNFMLIASGNSRKYDKDASPIPRSVRDRFTVFWELGYLPVDQEVQVLEEGVKYVLGFDTNPNQEQFSLNFSKEAFARALETIKSTFGECFVKAVASLRASKDVEEPPGPRAYIHATLLASSLYALGTLLRESARLAFVASVAGKITVVPGRSPQEVCEEAFEKFCGDVATSKSPGQQFFRERTARGLRGYDQS